MQGKDPRKGSSHDIDSLCCVIEADNISLKDVDVASRRARLVWVATLLHFSGISKLKSVVSKVGKFEVLSPRLDWAPQISPTWTSSLPMLEKFEQYFDYRKLEGFRQWWKKFDALDPTNFYDPDPTFLLIAITRFTNAVLGLGEEDAAYQFVDYISALEALLGESDEASFKLANRVSVLLGGTDDDCQDTMDFMRKAYATRSKLVHGSWPKQVKVRGTAVQNIEAIGRLHWYARRCIWRVLNLLILINEAPDSQIKKDWLSVKNSNTRKDWLTGVLDYCLVKVDMRQKLSDILSTGVDPSELLNEYKQASRKAFYGSMLEEKNEKARKRITMQER
jgi:hypothetical protein